MSGIYQKHINQSSVTNPSSGSTFIGVNESGNLFTKSQSGAVKQIDCPNQVCGLIKELYWVDIEGMMADAMSGSYSLFTSSRVSLTYSLTIDGVYDEGNIDLSEVFGPGIEGNYWAASGVGEIDLDPTGRKYATVYNRHNLTVDDVVFDEQFDQYSNQLKMQYSFLITSGETQSEINHSLRIVDGQDLFEGLMRVSLMIENAGAIYVEGTGTYSFQTPQMMNI